ncbi:MAG: phenylalanine--tRNA ligase subunit beta, partial [Chitinophagales bacterium]
SDAYCHLGVAKDLAAALQINYDFKGQVNLPSVAHFQIDNNDLPISVEVQDLEACPRYAGISIKGIEVKASPKWMQERLIAVGVRPINNIVDITNFVLHELGQPLHAFDADEITGQKVIVKKLPAGSKFTALDEIERNLDADDLMICDGEEKGMCIAGIFGGLKSGVKDHTTNIFLESARFHPIQTRRSASRHNLLAQSDAARRFEKGVDPASCVYALKRAALLIKELAGGTIASELIDVYPKAIERAQVAVKYRNVHRLIGVDIPVAEIKAIVLALDMEIVAETETGLTLTIGTNRADVLREADVIEEILRIYGFNKVPIPTTVSVPLTYSTPTDQAHKIKNISADYLASLGFCEMMGTSISNAQYYGEEDTQVVHLANSLNAHLNSMRKNMLFSGLEAILHNQNRQNQDVRLFELGNTYSKWTNKAGATQYEHHAHLSLFLTGNTGNENWQNAQKGYDFFDLKATVEALLGRLGIKGYSSRESKNTNLAYGLSYKLGKMGVVDFGQVSPKLLKKMGIKQAVYYADVNWDTVLKMTRRGKIVFESIPKYPSVRRDLALLLDKDIAFEQVAIIAIKTGKKLLRSVNLFDIYADEQKLGKGKKSYAVSFVFQDKDKTLTDKEIEKVMSKLMRSYQHQIGAEIR